MTMDKFINKGTDLLIPVFFFWGMGSLCVVLVSLFIDGFFSGGSSIDLVKGDQVGGLVGGIVGVFWNVMGVLLIVKTLKTQKAEFIETQKTIQNQQFESAFFQMLSQLQMIRETIISTQGLSKEDGKDPTMIFFGGARERLQSQFFRRIDEKSPVNYKDYLTKYNSISDLRNAMSDLVDYRSFIESVFEGYYSLESPSVGHYLRCVANIIKFVVDSKNRLAGNVRPNEIDQEISRYLKILESQLSGDELCILFYFGLGKLASSSFGGIRLNSIYERYSFPESIDQSMLLEPSHHWLYPNTVFWFLSIDQIKERKLTRREEHLPD